MVTSYLSPSWYRVAHLKPRLRGHTQIHRHIYRGEIWYVQQDHSSGRMYRFSPSAYQIIGKMDGNTAVQTLWEQAVDQLDDDAPTQNEIVRFLSQLHQADALICDIPPDSEEIFARQEKIRSAGLKRNLFSPLAIRIPLWDPEWFLDKTMPWVRPFFSIWGALLWCVVVISAFSLAISNWDALTHNIVDRVLSAENLIVIWLTFPIVKALHELGHGYAVKHWGGEVHEVGIMLLVFMPVPYVDASSSTAFRSKWQRSMVGAGGMLAELFVAALAFFLWLNVEPGHVRAVTFNIVLIASVSTILFNANPLLRYDGYYILSDLLEIPNLAQRSMAYLSYLFNRYLFRVKSTDQPPIHTSPGEPFWFVFYAVASFLYRILVYFGIILFIATKFFFIGTVLAIWACFSMFLLPVLKKINFIAANPMFSERRIQSFIILILLIAGVFSFLFYVPFPYLSRAEGVIWVPKESYVRAGSNGFLEHIFAQPNSFVRQGEVLIECRDPLLVSRARVLEAQIRELQAQYDAVYQDKPWEAQILQERLDHAQAQLDRALERINDLTIHSPSDGLFVIPRAQDLTDRFVKQGDLIGYVINVKTPTVRVVVAQSNADLVRQHTQDVEVMLVERMDRSFPAMMLQEVPGALEFLPSTILGSAGGGEIAIDPWDKRGTKSLNKFFQFDIAITEPIEDVKVGGRVYVRFDHGRVPLAQQWYRTIRQMFLRRFNV